MFERKWNRSPTVATKIDKTTVASVFSYATDHTVLGNWTTMHDIHGIPSPTRYSTDFREYVSTRLKPWGIPVEHTFA